MMPTNNGVLDLHGQLHEDWSFLAQEKNVEELDVSESNISETSLRYAVQLTHLKRLIIADTAIEDLTCLENFNALEELDMSGTKVTDLSTLPGSLPLKRLIAHDTAITSLEPLTKLTHLEVLKMERAKVKSVLPLGQIQTLQEIDLYENSDVRDITPLNNLNNLKALSVKNTALNLPQQLTCLEGLKHLTELDVNSEIEFAAKAVLQTVRNNKAKSLSTFFPSEEASPAVKKENEKQQQEQVNLDKLKSIIYSEDFQQRLVNFLEEVGIPKEIPPDKVLLEASSAIRETLNIWPRSSLKS